MEVSIDIETTGLNKGVHEIVQIAIVPYKDFEPMGRWVSYVKPLKPYLASSKAMEVNGLSLKGLESAPTPNQVRKSLLEWKEGCFPDEKLVPLGHNYAVFDGQFIELFFGKDTYDKYFDYRVMDTCIIARYLKDIGKLKSSGVGLDELIEYFELGARSTHDALEDAILTLKVYQKLCQL